jgi:hypothetical protein
MNKTFVKYSSHLVQIIFSKFIINYGYYFKTPPLNNIDSLMEKSSSLMNIKQCMKSMKKHYNRNANNTKTHIVHTYD